MRRGLIAGMIIGGVIGTYYGMSLGSKSERRLRRMADDFLDRGSEMMDRVKDRATRMMPIH
ncbi:MAG TPA: YtxH domain-containing protein [Firmicutes bacterium]|jgi:gas vesicle protein|nr:YtxH domain-containing protein [Bacillota bacterium]